LVEIIGALAAEVLYTDFKQSALVVRIERGMVEAWVALQELDSIVP